MSRMRPLCALRANTGIPTSLITVIAVVIAVATVAIVGVGFHAVIKRWQGTVDVEHFYSNQVSMINNATQAPDEVPIFFPYPVTPKQAKKTDATPAEPQVVPPTTPTPTAEKKPPALSPIANIKPTKVVASPPGPSRTPDSSEGDVVGPPGSSSLEASASKNMRTAFKAANPYCISPQFVVCEVAPQPAITINAFKYDGAVESRVESIGPFGQSSPNLQAKYIEEGKTRFFSFREMATLKITDKDADVGIPTGRNGGCTLVSVVRCTDVENSDYVIASLKFGDSDQQRYIQTLEDFKYYITRNTWCLLMCIYKEKDKGTSFSTFLDNMANGEELRVSQTQDTLLDTNIKTMVLADPVKEGNTTGVDIAYVGVYDRALTPYERQLIRASCEDILKSPSARTIEPKVVVDYDVTEITDAQLSANDDMRKSLNDKSASKFDLIYNVHGKDALYNTKTTSKSVELSKSDKFFSPTSNFIDMADGYTFELFFCVRQFSSEADSVVMCYSALEMNVRTPQIIAGVTSSTYGTNTQIEGHRFSVVYAADLPRFQSKQTLDENKWYHIAFTSESKMFINGEQVETYGRAVVALPLIANQARYITIGDYKNADGARVSTDAGKTINGYFGLSRIYNYPLNHAAIRERYTIVKNSNGGANVYGLP
jgi:hypothetical protein